MHLSHQFLRTALPNVRKQSLNCVDVELLCKKQVNKKFQAKKKKGKNNYPLLLFRNHCIHVLSVPRFFLFQMLIISGYTRTICYFLKLA